MVLDLNEKEKETVKYALEFLEKELKTERVKTDRKIWKTAMHDEELMIEELLKKVA